MISLSKLDIDFSGELIPPRVEIERFGRDAELESNSKSTSAPSRANRLIVTNIPFDINEQDITSAFLPHGPIHSVDIPRTESGKAQGFAFMWMLSRNNAEQAMSKCNGMKIRAGMAEELARMKQKKKKEMREEKKGRAGETKEEGETTSGAERVIAVDWALSKAKWEQEKAKAVEDGDIEMGESDNQASEDDNDDEDVAIGVNVSVIQGYCCRDLKKKSCAIWPRRAPVKAIVIARATCTKESDMISRSWYNILLTWSGAILPRPPA